MTRKPTALLAALVLGVVLSPAVFAGPPADKGKGQGSAQNASDEGGNGNSQGKGNSEGKDHGQGQGNSQGKGKVDEDNYDPYQDKYQGSKPDANHGQRVSDCNHRANSKQLKGQERKSYVEWCVDNGERYKYDDKRWTGSRSCYQQADDRRLSGDARRNYINSCVLGSIFK
ncbi:MAG TPA: PsiF family protein [Steroidobacteraceae bacterium]